MIGLQSLRAAIRGGNWNNGVQAGVFALNLNNAPSNRNVNRGPPCLQVIKIQTGPTARSDLRGSAVGDLGLRSSLHPI